MTDKPKMLKPREREEFILRYLFFFIHNTSTETRIDVLNRDFVDYYVAHTHVRSSAMLVGADRVPMLSRDLANMHARGILHRAPSSISNMPYGFPKWVYEYRLNRENALVIAAFAKYQEEERKKCEPQS